jgi:DNA invertase Pin-like site-specific DNA recombinase
MKLPTSLDALSGLRAARWVRESTERQVDRYGPDAQREQQDQALARYGLVDTGLAWQVAHSGRTVAGTRQFADMLARAGHGYDVLLVGYVSRFARDLRTAVNARHELHAAGAALLFCDERLLSSDEDAWETWAREAVEAEAYSRRLGRRIREGYAAKRRRHADPGGRAPFGFRRVGEPALLEPDPARSEAVRRCFELAAAGRTDRQVATHMSLGLYTVRSMLTNPLHAGRLRDGTPTRFEPLVDPPLYAAVGERRAARTSRRLGRPARRETYVLPMLECAACGQRLIGDTGRYRHRDPCPAFEGAVTQPPRPVRGQHRRVPGRSYPRDAYERIVPLVLARVRLGADDVAQAVALYQSAPGADSAAGAAHERIERERDRALARYKRRRDAAELEATMRRLDAEERAASQSADRPTLSAAEVVAYLRDLPRLWEDGKPEQRRALAEALFARVRALGIARIEITPTEGATERGLAEAFGVDEVVMVGARGVVTNLLYFTAVDRVGPSRAAVFGYLQSFLGVLFAVALLGERVEPIQIAGGLVVIASVVLSRAHTGSAPRLAQ